MAFANTAKIPTVCFIFQDNNECESGSHRCEQQCVNTPGGYACACRQGYTLNTDGFACDGL